MTTAITAVFISATATATDYPTRIRALSWGTAGTAGELVVKNVTGLTTIGAEPVVYKQKLGVSGSSDVYIPDLGVRVKNKAHVTLPSGGFVTLMLG
tara:strand:+ start:131 stop:418 length:288 start_codon:yes stop_codon:yes gene_type:complete